MATPRLRLGQLLVDAKLITEEDLQAVLGLQRTDGRRLGTLLVERRMINETQLTQILSHQLSIPWVSLLHIEFSRQLLNLVPHQVAERYCLVPIYVRHVRHQGETLYVAMDDPSNEDGLRACKDHSGLPVRAMIAPPSDIRTAIRVYYGVQGARSVPPELVDTQSPLPNKVPTSRPAPKAAAIVAELAVAGPMEGEGEASKALAELQDVLAAVGPQDSVPPPMRPDDDGPVIEVRASIPEMDASEHDEPLEETPPPSKVRMGPSPAERLRAIFQSEEAPPSSEQEVAEIPKPRGRAPRMVALTLLDGTTISLPAKGKRRASIADDPSTSERGTRVTPLPPPSQPGPPSESSDGPVPEEAQALTAHDLVIALRALSNGADASEVLGSNVRWESMFAALLSLLMKKHLIADWEFVEELKKKI